MVSLTHLPLSAQPGLKRFTPTQTADLTEEQWKSKLQEINKAGQPSNGPPIPWDFKSDGEVVFAENETGLSAINREKLAKSMDSIANLRSPYKEAYCTTVLIVVGAYTKNVQSPALVKRRVESVVRWFIDHGYDPKMIYAEVSNSGNVKEIEWQLGGGLFSKNQCEAERAKWRKSTATQYGNGGNQ